MFNKELFEIAKNVSKKAYAPYSNYKVGAAIRTKNGKIFSGCNVENSSYGLTNCAERTAIFKAVSEGEKEFEEILIYSNSGKMPFPCGACRQVISEFGDEIKITISSNEKIVESSIKKLLPSKFEL
ncbi:MAG: cytidine deaminase [Candidatus Cloacimonetes bacterium]|jgi:cytidine deaminase|nr:cytidine deaminase [Candidatus Cloacimonadota bacterium]MBT6994370.1 cytidine deaminase [Candidatus Cloacimonadota bacterium]MBT7469318.1 cytidine deaminase [Candidatus Cloacimonadota bacterium]